MDIKNKMPQVMISLICVCLCLTRVFPSTLGLFRPPLMANALSTKEFQGLPLF